MPTLGQHTVNKRNTIHKGFYMSTHVSLNLLNHFWEKDKMYLFVYNIFIT